jgi:hypothetical protein
MSASYSGRTLTSVNGLCHGSSNNLLPTIGSRRFSCLLAIEAVSVNSCQISVLYLKAAIHMPVKWNSILHAC